ncbi:MAG TPA: hypothetical protein VFG83_17085 [Kofleriaceae bacterium]|nr:hypothetical protein [Kofleriaceae bacterium]
MMTRLFLTLAAAWPVVLAYPTLAAAEPTQQPPTERSTTTYQFVPVPETAAQETGISKIIFLNRCEGGCIVKPGDNDARANTSSIVKQTSAISEFAYSDEVWNQVVDCVKEVYAPYDVEIVTEDPGNSTFHHEAIVAGDPSEVGLPENVGGIAPLSCKALNNVISFSFANAEFSGGDPIDICWTVAQESAHAFGLDHALNCYDPMTYLFVNPDTGASCGTRFFRDKDVQCGEYEGQPHKCVMMCSGSPPVQNSHQQLINVFGPNPKPIAGPEVTLMDPAPGTAVEDGFAIRFHALDDRGISHADLYINGWLWDSIDGHTIDQADVLYYMRAPDYPDGVLDLEIRAYNDLEVSGSATVQVQKGEPCQNADQCLEGMICDGGGCTYPPPTQELGDTCEIDRDCKTLLCAHAGEESHCTQDCIPGVVTSCPDNYECRAVGSGGVCWPAAEKGGDDGGCAIGGGAGLPAAWLGMGLVALFFGIGKRYRARSRG